VARVATASAAVLLAAVLAASDTSAAAKSVRPWFVWLHMTSAQNGYALSGKDTLRYRLLRTSDGGRVWRPITSIHPSSPPDVQGATILFSRGAGPQGFAVERSNDGGHTWTESLPVHTGIKERRSTRAATADTAGI
jgi:photosystem II stability/assembly factor-like uncharacterized protein